MSAGCHRKSGGQTVVFFRFLCFLWPSLSRHFPDVASASPETLTGVLERIIFFNEENHYTIAELKPDGVKGEDARVTITGPLPGVQCGETLQLTGEWTRHAQHGAQFKITAFKSELPSSVYGIRKYLGSGLVPGIGKVYANKIVDAFGTDTFRVLSEESGKLRKVPGIGKVRAASIKQAWEEQKTLREVHIFLQTYGVTTAQCVRIVKKWDAQAQKIIKAEPYRLAREIDGIGFKTADRLAINLGFANDAPPRLDAGLIYALQTLEEEGHTGYPREELVTYTANLLETSAERVEARIDALIKAKDLVEHAAGRANPPDEPRRVGTPRPTHSADAFVQLPHNDRAERKIAEVIQRLHAVPSGLPAIKIDAAVKWAQEKAGFEFHPLQAAALTHALAHKVSILTGGPGTGKTTILRALVEILKAKKARVTLAAPTGRAAQRLAETTGGFASTIHRLLAFDPAGGGFVHNESKPLATDFLIVDESSMLDTRLAAALLQAVPVRAHLLLVGDIDQLPSVGAGNVLKDLIAVSGQLSAVSPPESGTRNLEPASTLPVTRLQFVYRQGKESAIVTTAHAINEGVSQPPPVVSEVAKAQAWSDLNFIAAASAEDCLAKVIELCTKFIPQHFKWFDPVADVQVLAPMHKGVAGVANLNTQLQAALGRGDRGIKTVSGEYRPGDKLIQLRNNYDKNLFNGDIGTVASVDLQKGTLVADFDGEKHVFERGEFGDVALAYAISIHKCVAGDTWVLTARGWQQMAGLWPVRGDGARVRPLRLRLAGPDGVVTTDQIYRGRTEQALRLTTRHGYDLTGSHRHPIQVLDPDSGKLIWKRLPELKPRDFLPIRRGMELFPQQEFIVRYKSPGHPRRRIIRLPHSINPDIGRLLGYLVGNGSYDDRQDGDVRLTNADRSLVRDYFRILREQFGLRATLSRSTAHKTAPTWYVISKTFREWLSAVGLDHATARAKKVPASILQSPRAVQAAFLRGLFDTDGSASGNGTRVVLATTSHRLAEQVRMMLLNFGIVTALLHIPASDSWRVELYGANLRLFEENVGFGLRSKARQLRRMTRRGEAWNGKTNVDIIPGAAALWRALLGEIRARLGATKGRTGQGIFGRDFLTSGILLSRLARPTCQTNYRHLDDLLPALARRWPWVESISAFQTLAHLRRHRYFFDPIRRIEPTTAEMFDLHVPGTHAFLTNGFISHNSQGSEYPVVVIPLLKGHFMMLQRNLVYTAITRGRKKVFVVGEPAAWGMAVRNAESKFRHTHLREKILSAEAYRDFKNAAAGREGGAG
jgi:exodeoxyribonuclease V alpha subunit